MKLADSRTLKTNARNALAAAFQPPRKLFAIHIAVIAGASLLVNLLSFLLEQGIVGATGLDGIGTRALLQTFQTILSAVYSVAQPFWQIALFFVALQVFRGQTARTDSLTVGFRHLWSVLKLLLLKLLLVMVFSLAVGVVCSTVITILSYTPLAKDMLAFIENLPATAMTDPYQLMEDPEIMDTLMRAILPIMPFAAVGTLLGLLPLLYRVRLLDFALADHPEDGPWSALRTSWRLTKGNWKALLRLDLSFWWFYLLDLLLLALYYADLYLPLQISPTAAFWLCCGAHAVGQIILYSLANPLVQTTYAAAYDDLYTQMQEEEAQKQTAQTPFQL